MMRFVAAYMNTCRAQQFEDIGPSSTSKVSEGNIPLPPGDRALADPLSTQP